MSTLTPAPEVRGASPYVGPRPFTREDRDGFFGREAEVERLVSEVISSLTLVIYAVSGAGKTSLLAAGLRPALRDQGFETLPTVRFAARAEIPDVNNVFTYMTLRSLARPYNDDPDERWLANPNATLADALASVPTGDDENGFPRPRALVFDQFEELFALHEERWPDRKAFIAQIGEALDVEPELRVVFALREEYLAQFGEHAGGLPRTRFHLERLRHDAALRAVTGPLKGSGRAFAPGVADRLVDDLQQTVGTEHGQKVKGEFIEPLHLQVVCHQLWSRIGTSTTLITDEHLDVYGNVDEALTSYYDEAIARAASVARVPEYKLRSGLEQLFITSSGTRAIVFAGEATRAMGDAAVRELERLHVVRTEWRAGAAWLELAHDRLIAPVRASDAKVIGARRRRVVGRLVTAIVVAVAVAGGVVLAALFSTQAQNAQLSVATARSKQVTKATVSTLQVSIRWIEAFNSGRDRLAARMMKRVIRVTRSAIVAGRSQPVVLGRHPQRATGYLEDSPCWLGPAPSQLGNNIAQATWLVDPTRNRHGHHGCRPGRAWLLVITVANGKVTGLDHRSLGVINAPPPAKAKPRTVSTPTGTTSTGGSNSPAGGSGVPSSVPTSSSPVATHTTVGALPPATSVTSTNTVSETSSAASPSTTTQASNSTSASVPTGGSSPPPPTSSTFTIVTTTTPGG